MDEMVKRAVRECTEASDDNRFSFGEVVVKLMAAGVERYHADLSRSEKTYYMPGGDSEVMPSAPVQAEAAQTFSPAAVEAAVRAIQAGRITYKEFCASIAAAGCVGYMVSLAGRRAVYYGRSGDSYIEPFPEPR
jgi:uncharacterized protein YbcV (DUF1398 family)